MREQRTSSRGLRIRGYARERCKKKSYVCHLAAESTAALDPGSHRPAFVDTPIPSMRTHDRRLEIAEFDPFELCPLIANSQPRRDFERWSRALGVLGTLFVHGVALNAVGWGTSAHIKAPIDVPGMGTTRADLASAPAGELVLLTLDISKKGDEDLPGSIASLKPSLTEARVELLDLKTMAMAADPDADTASSTVSNPGDPALRTLMFGRYTGQISARIERVWIRPRAPVVDGTQVIARNSPNSVQIRQDARGNVQEVLMLDCPGTEAWRRSLVVAINQSSPLPAPPTPAVFTPLLNMTFESTISQISDETTSYRVATGPGWPRTAEVPAAEPPSSVLGAQQLTRERSPK
jgi:hypothetical protein